MNTFATLLSMTVALIAMAALLLALMLALLISISFGLAMVRRGWLWWAGK